MFVSLHAYFNIRGGIDPDVQAIQSPRIKSNVYADLKSPPVSHGKC